MGVVKLTDYRPPLEVVEHRVAQLEDGFTRVANELMDSLLMADLTARQLKVMLAIMRKTYGFNKPMDRITNTQIAAMTGIHHTHICAAKRQLIERKFLIADGVRIGVNKVVSEWIIQDSLTLAKSANNTLAKSANNTLAKSANNTLAKSANNTLAKSAKHKRQYTKDNTPLPPKGECEGLEEKQVSQEKPGIDYQAVLSAYNTTLGDRLPQAETLNDKRRRAIKRLLTELKEPTVEAVENYFAAFAERAPKFYFGESDRGWRASFDYLLRSDTLLKTRENAL